MGGEKETPGHRAPEKRMPGHRRASSYKLSFLFGRSTTPAFVTF